LVPFSENIFKIPYVLQGSGASAGAGTDQADQADQAKKIQTLGSP